MSGRVKARAGSPDATVSTVVETESHLLAAFDSTLAAFSKAGDDKGTARVVAMLVEVCPPPPKP